MDKTSTDRLLEEICGDNVAAINFLKLYLRLAHQIDDCVDCAPTKEQLLQTFLLMLSMLSLNSFYLQHREQLYPLLAVSLSRYATSVEWEGSQEARHKSMADHLRSDGAILLEFVSLVCGGIERMRLLSPLIWEDSWRCHHDSTGNPT
jgi:hypothetical protein